MNAGGYTEAHCVLSYVPCSQVPPFGFSAAFLFLFLVWRHVRCPSFPRSSVLSCPFPAKRTGAHFPGGFGINDVNFPPDHYAPSSFFSCYLSIFLAPCFFFCLVPSTTDAEGIFCPNWPSFSPPYNYVILYVPNSLYTLPISNYGYSPLHFTFQ